MYAKPSGFGICIFSTKSLHGNGLWSFCLVTFLLSNLLDVYCISVPSFNQNENSARLVYFVFRTSLGYWKLKYWFGFIFSFTLCPNFFVELQVGSFKLQCKIISLILFTFTLTRLKVRP